MTLDPHFREVATDLAKQAGEIMLRYFTLDIETEWKGDTTPLTKADTEINSLVVATIGREFPSHGTIAEEGGTDYVDQEFAWVCDPIDGTRPFAWGTPLAHFSLALVSDGQPVLAVVNDPFTQRIYLAEKGMGARVNDLPVHVSREERRQGGRHIIGTMYWPRMQYGLSKMEPTFDSELIQTFNLATIVNMGMMVARGAFDATLFAGEKPWDCAAIKLIVEEAGGKVTDLYGNEQRYDREIRGMIASNGLLHDRLVRLVRESGALDGKA